MNRLEILDFHLDPGTVTEYVELIKDAIDRGVRHTVFAHNLHTVFEYYRDRKVENAYQGVFALVDGMPLIWLLKLLGHNVSRDQRLTYAQFIWPIMEAAASNGWRVFFVGNEEQVNQRALARFRESFPGLQIAGRNGFFDVAKDSEGSRDVLATINAFQPDLCLIGMGSPRQELWVSENRKSISAPVTMVTGACLEYVAGAVGTPPVWMGRAGLEWSYRFFENPRRFAFRYFLEPWLLALMILKRRFGPGRA